MRRFAYTRKATASHLGSIPSSRSTRSNSVAKKIIIVPKIDKKSSNRRLSQTIEKFPRKTLTMTNESIESTENLETQSVIAPSIYDDEEEDLNSEDERLIQFQSLTENLENGKVLKMNKDRSCRDETEQLSTRTQYTTTEERHGFVADFILQESRDQYAIIIQTAFRLYRNKMHWKKFIQLRIKYQRRLLNLFVTNWLLSLRQKNIKKTKEVYRKFKSIYLDLPFVKRGRELSPFQYYYITGQIFIPKGYHAQTLFSFVHMINCITKRKLIIRWHETARHRRNFRAKTLIVHFPLKKYQAFGFYYLAFQNWHRMALWKKKQESMPENSSDFITINTKEVCIQWKIKEEQLNTKIKRVKRANEFHKKAILNRAVKALFNRSLQVIAKQTVINEADMFRNAAAMKLAHRAWTKYMELQQHRRQVKHDCIKAWYEIAYNKAKTKHIISFYRMREEKFFAQKIINKWNKTKEANKMRSLLMSFKVQKNASLVIQILYHMMHKDDLASHVQCFRKWIKYTRARHRWHTFVNWVQNVNDPNDEFKHQVVGELIHFASNKIVGRLPDTEKIIPRKVGVCFETMQSELLREIYQQRKEIDSSKLGDAFAKKKEKPKKPDFKNTKDLLLRCFLLRLNKIKRFEKYGSVIDPAKNEPHIEATHDEKDLQVQLDKNRQIFKNNLKYKELTDTPIILAIQAHEKALQMQQVLHDFTVSKDIVVNKVNVKNLELNYTPIVFFPDAQTIVKAIIKDILKAPSRMFSTFSDEYEESMAKFSNRLRNPEKIGQKTGFTNVFAEFAAQSSLVAKGLQTIKNDKIESFQSGAPITITQKSSLIELSGLFNKQSSRLDTTTDSNDFTASSLRSQIGEYTTQHDMIFSINKFFSAFAHTPLKSTTPVTPDSPNIFRDNTDQLTKRRVKKNIGQFISLVSEQKSFGKAPLESLQQFAKSMTNAILTAHFGLRTTKIEAYCEELPFLDPPALDSDEIIMLRVRLWNCIKRKYPKIESTINKMQLGSFSQFSSSSAQFSKADLVGGKTKNTPSIFDSENISAKDAYIACFAIPYILEEDSLADFMRDHILATAGQQNITQW